MENFGAMSFVECSSRYMMTGQVIVNFERGGVDIEKLAFHARVGLWFDSNGRAMISANFQTVFDLIMFLNGQFGFEIEIPMVDYMPPDRQIEFTITKLDDGWWSLLCTYKWCGEFNILRAPEFYQIYRDLVDLLGEPSYGMFSKDFPDLKDLLRTLAQAAIIATKDRNRQSDSDNN